MSTFTAWAITLGIFIGILLLPRGAILSLLWTGLALFLMATLAGFAILL